MIASKVKKHHSSYKNKITELEHNKTYEYLIINKANGIILLKHRKDKKIILLEIIVI